MSNLENFAFEPQDFRSLSQDSSGDLYYDVVICGGGLAGLTLARQITLEVPAVSLLLIEGVGDKSQTGAIQVGESTIEISANYLANIVGLRDYLEATHYHKWGLRFFFGEGETPIQERPEFGTSYLSPVYSYQLDRALLETDLKKLNRAMGIQMLEAGKVEDIVLASDGGLHEVLVFQKNENVRRSIKCRWVIDAMGRRRFIQRKLGIACPQNFPNSSSWFRMKGRIDVCDLVPRDEVAWHARVPDNNRYYSTTHLMSKGRWVWLIPLASGNTSIGIVTREDIIPFSEYNTYERAMRWLEKHEPLLWNMIHEQPPVDFQCLRHYSYTAKRVFSMQRWACTGDAAVFADPFISPGIDQLGFANTIITDMIKQDSTGTLQAETVEYFNATFLSFHTTLLQMVLSGYPFHDDALVMGAKLLWTFAVGFFVNGPQRFNRIYLSQQKTAALKPDRSKIFLLALRMEKLFTDWSALTTQHYTYTFFDYLEVPGMMELYLRCLQAGKSLEELLVDQRMALEYLEELAQIIFLLALADVKPEIFARLTFPVWLNAWGIGLDEARWEADKLFAPTTQPRNLRFEQFASLFGVQYQQVS